MTFSPDTAAIIRRARNANLPWDDDRLYSLPLWVREYRPGQVDAINNIVEAFQTNDLVILDAPTGSGKTLIGETVRRLLGKRGSLYICSTKTLQDQFLNDFEYAAVLKGRSNYPTEWSLNQGVLIENDRMAPTAADCTKSEGIGCTWCSSVNVCPYEVAKHTALAADVAVLNTSYFLTETNGPGRFKGRPLVIVDEADTLENEVMGYVSVDIAARRVKEYGLGEPEKVTKPEAWMEWAIKARSILHSRLSNMPEPSPEEKNVKVLREWNSVARLLGNVTQLVKGLEDGEWVYTGKDGNVAFKPVRVDHVGKKALWGNADKWLLMSATIISPHEMVESLGYEGDWAFVEMPSEFDVESRKVKVMPLANMAKKVDDPDAERDKCVRGIRAIIARHPGENVLVHSVSYDLTNEIRACLANEPGVRLYTYSQASERDKTLRDFINDTRAARVTDSATGQSTGARVLLAPSMDRGVDLPDDLCRVVILAKVPFPYLGDRQINARLHSYNGQSWYNVQAVRKIVQMTGRATRHKDDWSVCYIIDSTFSGVLWNKGQGLFPKWWTDALDWRDNVRI